MRSFLKKKKLGKFNEEGELKKEELKEAAEEKEKAACADITTGSRCQVKVVGQPTKLGTVMYVGKQARPFSIVFMIEQVWKAQGHNLKIVAKAAKIRCGQNDSS